MRRVLVFSTDDHLPPTGGAEQAFGHITRRMPEYEFDLICAKLHKGAKAFEKVGNVNIYRMGFGVPRLDGFILALFGHVCAFKLMKQHSYDLLWSIMASYGAFAAVRVKKKTGLPLVLTLQEGDSFEYIYHKVRFVRRSFDEIFAQADAVQAISNYLLSWGREMGYRGPLGRLIPNGVEVESFTRQFPAEEVQQMRRSFGFPPEACILITSSRLEKKNGVGDVIAALALLPREVCFVICGSGSLDAQLRAQAETLGLSERVKFMGFVDPSQLPLLMKASDIFIRPSLSEGLGNAFLEAMAAGIITVGTNAGGIPDFLTDGKTGFMVGIEDPRSIADTVERIRALEEENLTRIRGAAKELILREYHWERVTADMRALFEEVAAARG